MELLIQFGLTVIEEADKKYHIAIRSGIDAGSVLDLDQTLNDAVERGASWIIIDMSEVDYVSSAGVMRLLVANDQATEAGGKLIVYGASNTVLEVFKLLEIGILITLVADRESALAAVKVK